MKSAQYRRLVENLKRDGVLTSAPLIGRIAEDTEAHLYVISGNHRVGAALEAGIEEAECIKLTEPISRQRFTAIQLSHNAIAGEDDPNALRRLYELLEVELKEYSGLSDEDFAVADLNVTTVSGVSPLYCEVVFAFLAEDAQAVQDFVASAERWAKKARPLLVAHYDQFNQFLDSVAKLKQLRGILNSALALSVLIEMAGRVMEEEESERSKANPDQPAAAARQPSPASAAERGAKAEGESSSRPAGAAEEGASRVAPPRAPARGRRRQHGVG